MVRGKALVIEEDVTFAAGIRSCLLSLGYDITAIVDTGEGAIEKAEADPPDIVMLPFLLKGKFNGIEVAEIMQSHFAAPTLFLIDHAVEEQLIREKCAIPITCLLKPLQERELKITLEATRRVAKLEADLKKAEKHLQEMDERAHGLSEASFEAIFLSENGFCLDHNRAASQMFGFSSAEIIGRPCTDLISLEHRAQVKEKMISGYEKPYEISAERKDGTSFPVEIRGKMIPYKGKTVRVSAIRDISERKKSEAVLQASQLKNLCHQQHTPLAVIEWNADFEVVDWNPAAERIFGYSQKEAMGRHALDLIVPESGKATIDSMWKGLLKKKGGEQNSNENVTKTGETIYCEWYNTPLLDSKGTVIGVTSLAHNITDRIKTEKELRLTNTRWTIVPILFSGFSRMVRSAMLIRQQAC